MTDNYNDVHGEHPGDLNLTTCTGCGEPRRYYGARKGTHCQNCGKPWAEDDANAIIDAAVTKRLFGPDKVTISRADLQALLDGCIQQHTNDEQAWSVCGCCGATSLVGHAKGCVVKRLDALSAASGDDGGTP